MIAKPKTQPVKLTRSPKLTEPKLAAIKDQVLLVLADYRDMRKNPLSNEGTRIEIANRILDNVRLVQGR